MPTPIMSARLLLPALAWGVFAGSAISEENAEIPPPSPPWVAEVPKNSTFTITITYPDASGDQGNETNAADNSDRPVKVQVWRDSQARRILINHANGAVSEGFLFDSGFVIRSTANSPKTFVSQSGTGRDAALDFFTKEFQGTQWIAADLYRGAIKTETGDVYLYEQKPGNPPPAQSDGDAPPVGFRPLDYMQLNAAIRADTKTPVSVRIGPANYTFSPMEAWSGTIVMPENFQSSAENFSKQLNVLQELKKKK